MGLARSSRYRDRLDGRGLQGPMGRRANPCGNDMAESVIKTLKVEDGYPMAFETAEDGAQRLPRFIDGYNKRRPHSAIGYPSPKHFQPEVVLPGVVWGREAGSAAADGHRGFG